MKKLLKKCPWILGLVAALALWWFSLSSVPVRWINAGTGPPTTPTVTPSSSPIESPSPEVVHFPKEHTLGNEIPFALQTFVRTLDRGMGGGQGYLGITVHNFYERRELRLIVTVEKFWDKQPFDLTFHGPRYIKFTRRETRDVIDYETHFQAPQQSVIWVTARFDAPMGSNLPVDIIVTDGFGKDWWQKSNWIERGPEDIGSP